MLVYDVARRPITLGQELAQGGEAVVYRVETAGHAAQLGKIYVPGPRPEYEKKLGWMVSNPPQDPTRHLGHASIAWPLGLLYDKQGRFVGYLMPFIQDAVPLLQIFNPLLRKRTLPGFNWRYLHRTARNLAAALGALHERGYVMGDLHESNFLVTPQTMVTLIDTDSFQVIARHSAKPVIYRCPVGKIEYTPPELQGRSLHSTPRRPEHDNFGLGVLIFQLLMQGSHPFRGQWLGDGEPLPLEEKIRQGCFPYMASPPAPVAPPRRGPSLDLLHPQVAELVYACFIDGHAHPRQRPIPAKWIAALAEAEQALVTCTNGHYYSGHLQDCPTCTPLPQAQKRRMPRCPTRAIPGLQGWVSWSVERVCVRLIGRTPREALRSALAGAAVWAAGGAVFGAVGGGLAGALGEAMDGTVVWIFLWAGLWAIGWWAFGETLGTMPGQGGNESLIGLGGAITGVAIGGGLGWIIGQGGVQEIANPALELAAQALGVAPFSGLLGSALAGVLGGSLVWLGAWGLTGAIGGALSHRTFDFWTWVESMRRVPGKTKRAARTAAGAVEGALAGGFVGLCVGPITGLVVNALGTTLATPWVQTAALTSGGALLGATIATVGRSRIPFLAHKLGPALEVIGMYVGLIVGLLTGWPGLLFETNTHTGFARAILRMVMGVLSGLFFGLFAGTLAGAVRGAIRRIYRI